jgi:hypothetical protein
MRPKQVFFYFMKTPSSSSSPAKLSDLKVLAIVGAIVAVLMFAVPILLWLHRLSEIHNTERIRNK